MMGGIKWTASIIRESRILPRENYSILRSDLATLRIEEVNLSEAPRKIERYVLIPFIINKLSAQACCR